MAVAMAKRPVGFVLQLQLKQKELGLGDGAWAAHLGMDASHWWRLRHGQREVTTDLVRRVLELWPEDFRHLELGLLAPEDGNGNRDGDREVG